MQNRDAAIALANFGRFGARTLEKLRAFFGSPSDIWSASPEKLRLIGMPEKGIAAFVAFRAHYDAAAVEAKLRPLGIDIVAFDDEHYPALLREISDPPAALFFRGDIRKLVGRPHLAVVGSRHCTEYGLQVTKSFSRRIAQAGVVIVSGLAYGIDEAAHRATLDVQGTTVAVLPSGMLGVDNARQLPLINAILEGGGVVMSEFPLSSTPRKQSFPMRNRIVAGLCEATLVVEAAEKSGSLITARLALECNRDVFAVPGPITSPSSDGTNRFISDGANMALRPEDVLRSFGLAETPSRERTIRLADLPSDHATIMRMLQTSPLHIDDIVRSSTLTISAVNTALTSLEMCDLIVPLGGMRYALAVQIET